MGYRHLGFSYHFNLFHVTGYRCWLGYYSIENYDFISHYILKDVFYLKLKPIVANDC